MKKLLFALMLCTAMFSDAFAQKPTEGSYIYIDWGRQSKSCRGFGICDIKAQMTVGEAVLLVIAPITSTVQIVFDRKYYDDHKSSFSNGYLIIEEDFPVNLETSRKLGLPDGYVIKTGKYLVKFDKATNTYNCTF